MRKLCRFALPFCAVIFAVGYGLPRAVWLPVGAAAALLGLLAGIRKRLPVCLVCLGLVFGLLWAQGYALLFRAPAQALAGQTTAFTATVLDWPAETSSGRLRTLVRLHLPGAPDPKVLLYLGEEDAGLVPGDEIAGTARFSLTDTIRGEETTYYEAQAVFLQGGCTGSLSAEHPEQIPLFLLPTYAARAIRDSVRTIFPEDVAGFLCALLTGDKSNLTSGTYSALQRSGAAHIVAVSGLHLTFFAGFLSLLFRRRGKLTAALTILLIFLFAAVAGFTPSVLRAAFMTSMTLIAPLTGRRHDPFTTLSAALLLLLMLDPPSALSVSLQLSFASVAGIHLVSGPLQQAMTRSLTGEGPPLRRLFHRLLRVCCANLSVTLGALLFTTPLCALYFDSVSLIAPVTNLLILWAVSLAFAPGLLLTLLGIALPGAAAVLTFPVTLLSRYVLAVTRALGSLSFSSVTTGSVYACVWLVFAYVLVIAAVLSRTRRPFLPLCAGAATLCLSLLLTILTVAPYPMTVTMLDVGQGQSILLYSGGKTALIDCGGSKDNAGDIAADYLQSLGVSRLDLLILTHCHSDHANGVAELFARVKIGSLILPELESEETLYRSEILALAEAAGTDVTLLSSNCALTLGDASLTLYAPLGDGGTNEEGLSVLASSGPFDLLVTGDANSFVEALLLKYNDLPDIEVLVAGHHGSRSSTSELLLDAVTPETCLISVGYNTYGHPHEDTLSRLTERGIAVYRTDTMGHLTIRIDENGDAD